MKFQEFKKVVGLSGPAIAEATGYTREALYRAFKRETESFKRTMYDFVNSLIDDEVQRHKKRMDDLKRLRDEVKPFAVKAQEMDRKVSYLADRRAK